MHCSGQALPSWIASRVPPETLVFNCAFQVFFIRAFPPFPGILQPSSSCKAEPRLPPPPDCAPAPRRGSCIAVVVQHAIRLFDQRVPGTPSAPNSTSSHLQLCLWWKAGRKADSNHPKTSPGVNICGGARAKKQL